MRDAGITQLQCKESAVVFFQAKNMKEPWCIAASDKQASASTLMNHYAKRWTTEPGIRDTKDMRFGMDMSSTRVGNVRVATDCFRCYPICPMKNRNISSSALGEAHLSIARFHRPFFVPNEATDEAAEPF